MEYGKESTRGKSELTTNIDNKTSGLDKDMQPLRFMELQRLYITYT